MKTTQKFTLLSVLASGLWFAYPQPLLAGTQLTLERRTNAFDLTVSSLSQTGALFVFVATNLQTLAENPSVLLQTNILSTNAVSTRIFAAGDLANQAFFSAVHWPGLSTDDFGDPENHEEEPPPEMILLTSGAPTNLISGQTFTVDFFVTDTAAQLLSITQAVSIRILRQSDGAIHPDAQVSPSTGQLVGGHLRLTITVTASTPLDGYTLGLGPSITLLTAVTAPLNTYLNLDVVTLDEPSTERIQEFLDGLRTYDLNSSWDKPLPGDPPVHGTYGEWRGYEVHEGVDLRALPDTTVSAARGGLVTYRGTMKKKDGSNANMGDVVVIDHGAGYFSRYLHLDHNFITVKTGNVVKRGDPIATRLYSGGGWPAHLHFEIRFDPDYRIHILESKPAPPLDPLQLQGMFTVRTPTKLPQLEDIWLTQVNP